MKKILVIGSLNMDTVIETPRIPVPGETIMGSSVKNVPGGKGANQVYTIGKLGGDVSMIGAVGSDTFGDMLIDNLKKVNVNTEGIERIQGGTTGQAFIPVDDSGENSIIVIGGTNGQVDESLLKKYEYLMDGFDPGVKALKGALDAGDTLAAAMEKAAAASEEGFKAAKSMLAVHGKPAVKGEASREMDDPGAAVAALIMQAAASASA